MRLKHRGNGHIALGHGKGVVSNFHILTIHLPLLEVVPGSGGGGQGHGVASGGGGHICLSRAACGGIDRHRVCGLGQGDLQLVQLGRLGVRAGELQGAGSGLGDYQVEGDGAGLALLIVHLGSSRHVAGLDLVAAPSQLIGGGAAAVGSGDGIGPRHRSVIMVGNGVLLVEAVEVFPMAGPATGGHLEIPLAIAVELHIVELAELRLQRGGDILLAGEHKGILGGVLIPLHQALLGRLDGLLGIGKGIGGRSIPCQYLLGSLNGLGVLLPAVGVPLAVLVLSLIHQSLELRFGHFRSGNHRTGAADLTQAGPHALCSRHKIEPHISSGLPHCNGGFCGVGQRGDVLCGNFRNMSKCSIVRHCHIVLPVAGGFKNDVQLLHGVSVSQIHLPPLLHQVVVGRIGVAVPIRTPLGVGVPVVGTAGTFS